MNSIYHFSCVVTFASISLLITFHNHSPTSFTDQNLYTDPRDGQTYELIEMSNSIWFKENLKYNTPHSICYDSLEANSKKYGRLYPFDEALNGCPEYWHLPTRLDIETLYKQMGSQKINKLAAPEEWNIKKRGRLTNSTDLSILPAGRIDSFLFYSKSQEKWIDTLAFHQKGVAASYWLKDKETHEGVLHWHLGTPIGDIKSGMHRHKISIRDHKFSIRCICEKSARM